MQSNGHAMLVGQILDKFWTTLYIQSNELISGLLIIYCFDTKSNKVRLQDE